MRSSEDTESKEILGVPFKSQNIPLIFRFQNEKFKGVGVAIKDPPGEQSTQLCKRGRSLS